MNKKLVLITAPISSRSGYGAHCRDIIRALLRKDKYDIKILDVRWGDCPRNALDKERDKDLLNLILPQPKLERQPDIYIDIRIPQEFETFGKFNIGITAGTETHAVSAKWLDCCNKMDLIIVPSEHSKSGFVNTWFDKMQNTPDGKQQKIGEQRLEKPIEVVFEGIDDSIYKPLKVSEVNKKILKTINDIIDEKFVFLFVGQWVKGNYGEDRKDIGRLIKVFCETFANKKKKPALILKTSGATFSILDREAILSKIKDVKNQFPNNFDLPSVYLLHGDLSDNEMNSLYNHPKIKAMVTFTHGEGFGRPLLEATLTGLPVIATGWSGQLDFLDENNSIIVGGELKQVPKSAVWEDVIIPESQWFNIDEHSAFKALDFVFNEDYNVIKRKADGLMYRNREKFTLNKMADKLDDIIENHTKHISSQVQLKLPKLKKAGEKKELPAITLPKLKRIK